MTERLQELVELALKKELTKETKTELVKELFTDKDGNIDLSRLQLKNFEGDLLQHSHVVKNNLSQGKHLVIGSLHQQQQTVYGNLYQQFQKVKGDLEQLACLVEGSLFQSGHKVNDDLFQNRHSVKGSLFQSEHLVKNDLYQSAQIVKNDLIQANQKVEGYLQIGDNFYGGIKELKFGDWVITDDIGNKNSPYKNMSIIQRGREQKKAAALKEGK